MNRTDIKDERPSESLLQRQGDEGKGKSKINTKVFRMDFSDREEEESIEFIQIQDKTAKGGPGNSEQIRGD